MTKPCKTCGIIPNPIPSRYKRADYQCNKCHRQYCKTRGYKGGKPSKGYWTQYYSRPLPGIKKWARTEVLKALRKGIIKRQPCQECGHGLGHAHHPDYSKPLAVIWLCQPCHVLEHKKAEGK